MEIVLKLLSQDQVCKVNRDRMCLKSELYNYQMYILLKVFSYYDILMSTSCYISYRLFNLIVRTDDALHLFI